MARISEMARKYAEFTGIPLTKATKQWTDLCKFIREMILSGEEVGITGIGKFGVKVRHGRKYNNPKNGDMMVIPDHCVPYCRFSVVLKSEIRDTMTPQT